MEYVYVCVYHLASGRFVFFCLYYSMSCSRPVYCNLSLRSLITFWYGRLRWTVVDGCVSGVSTQASQRTQRTSEFVAIILRHCISFILFIWFDASELCAHVWVLSLLFGCRVLDSDQNAGGHQRFHPGGIIRARLFGCTGQVFRLRWRPGLHFHHGRLRVREVGELAQVEVAVWGVHRRVVRPQICWLTWLAGRPTLMSNNSYTDAVSRLVQRISIYQHLELVPPCK